MLNKIFPILLVAISACSSAPKTQRTVPDLIPSSLRLRRPVSAGADASVGPGGVDYKSAPLPNAQLDCETAARFFENWKFRATRQCLGSAKGVVIYRLRRLQNPLLELQDPEDAPACVSKLMAKIPLPREILFRHRKEDEDAPVCYSARLDIEADEWLGAKLPTHRYDLKINLPLDPPPESDAEFLRQLTAWVLTPIWNETGGGFPARVVPESICKTCLGEEGMRDSEHDLTRWP